jgi:hypothetical protein
MGGTAPHLVFDRLRSKTAGRRTHIVRGDDLTGGSPEEAQPAALMA